MTKVFLGTSDAYRIIDDNSSFYGVAGDTADRVIIEPEATNISVNANVDRIDFSKNISDYTFKAGFGANMEVYDSEGGTLIVSIPLQTDADGTQLVFANGGIDAIYNAGAIGAGGVTLTGTASSILPDASSIDNTVVSGAGVSTETPLSSKVFLESGDTHWELNDNVTIYGVSGDTSDSVVIAPDAKSVSVNANVDRVDFSGNLDTFTFKAGFGANMHVYTEDGITLLAQIPLQIDADGTQLVFSDGGVDAIYNSGAIEVGGSLITGNPGAITPDSSHIDTSITTGESEDQGEPQTVSIDNGSFINASPEIINASTGNFIFTDDANVQNYVEITGFSNDDVVNVSNASEGDYFFTNEGSNVIITYVKSETVVNRVDLIGIVSANDIVDGSEASFEAAIGFNAFTLV